VRFLPLGRDGRTCDNCLSCLITVRLDLPGSVRWESVGVLGSGLSLVFGLGFGVFGAGIRVIFNSFYYYGYCPCCGIVEKEMVMVIRPESSGAATKHNL